MKTKNFASLLTAVLAVASSTLMAQNTAVESDSHLTTARVGLGYLSAASVRGTASEVDGHFMRANVDFTRMSGRDWRFGIGVQTILADLSWSAPIMVDGTAVVPFEKIDEFGISANGFYALNQRWGILGFGSIGFARGYQGSGIEAISLSRTDTYNVGALLAYSVNPRLRISGGFIGGTRLEQSDLFIPVFSVRYRANDHWTLRLFEASGIDNLDIAGVDYDVHGDRRIVVSGSVQWANYSIGLGTLNDFSGRNLALEDRAYRVLVGASYTTQRGLFVQPYVGHDVYRTMKFVNAGQTLENYRLRNGWIVGVNAGLRF